HRDWVCTLAFAPDGKTIASGCCDWARHRGGNTAHFPGPDPGCEGQWKLWDVATGALQRTVDQPGRLRSLAIEPTGKSLACGIGRDGWLYELARRRSAEPSPSPGRLVTSHDFEVTSVAFTRDGSAVLSGSHDETVKCTRLATGQLEWRAPGS